MTKQRDLKRLVRERQERTGESYTTALRHVRGERSAGVPVLELIDVSDIGDSLGLRCRLLVAPRLAERVDVAALVRQLRTVLLRTANDHAFSLMRATVLCGQRPYASWPTLQEGLRFRDRIRAGIGGIDDSGRMLAFAVAGRPAPEMAVFLLWFNSAPYSTVRPSLLITPSDFELGDGDGDGEWDLRPFGFAGMTP
jgi:hypothetical protein